MDTLITVALVGSAIWLLILTLVILLVIRQIGILTVRFIHTDGTALLENDGPEIGSLIPSETLTYLPELQNGYASVLLISAHCAPCRELATELTNHQLELPVVTLLAGSEAPANELAALLPSNFQIIRDPNATAIAEILGIKSTPFTIAIQDGMIASKTYIYSTDTFIGFVKQFVQNKATKLVDRTETQHVN